MKMTEYAEKMGISNVSEMNTSGAADVFGELQKLPAPQLLAVIIFYLFMFVFMAVVLGFFFMLLLKIRQKMLGK